MERPSPKFPAGRRIFLSFVTPALLLLTAGATTSSAGCLDDAGEFVWGLCAPMFAAGADGNGDLYVHGQLHESANVGSLAGASSNVLWSLKNSGGTTVLALYRNDTTDRYDLAITGQLVTQANFGDYSAAEDYWSLKESSSYLVALKEAGAGLTDGSLLVAGQVLDEATFQCDLEFVKNFTENYWVKMDRWGNLLKSTDGKNYTTLHDFYTDLEQKDAFPVDLELETVVYSPNPAQVQAATAYVMDNKANLYVYDILSSATDIRSVTNAFLDVVDFEIGSNGVDNELYLLRLAGDGTIVNVTGSDFQSSKPWVDDGADALNIELVSNPTVTGGTSGLFVLSDVVESSSGVIYRLDKGTTTKFSVVAMDDDDSLAFDASPRSNILMLYQDTNADGTGEMYFYNKKDDTAEAREFTACGTESLGFDGTAGEERFAKFAYQLNHAVLPQAATERQPVRKVEIAYLYSNWIAGTELNTAALNSDIELIQGAEPASCATFEHVLLLAGQIESATVLASLFKQAAEIVNEASVPFYVNVWGPGKEMFFDKVNDDILSATLDYIIGLPFCRGAQMGEVYGASRLVGSWGAYVDLATTTQSIDYFRAINRTVGRYEGKRLLWHEPCMIGPPGRRAWWGFILYDTQAFRDTVWNSTVAVMLHADNEFSGIAPNLDAVYGTWLGSDSRTDWGASLQNFWWGYTQYGDYNPHECFIDKSIAKEVLGIPDGIGKLYHGNNAKQFRLNPGKHLSYGAHTYGIPNDILKRQLTQYLSMGATYIETEHTSLDPGSERYNEALKPVLEDLQSGKIVVPAKRRIRNHCLASIALSDQDSATDPSMLWWHKPVTGISLEDDWRFGIFVPSYKAGWNDDGYDARSYQPPSPGGRGIHWSYFKRITGWYGDNFEKGFEASGVAIGWGTGAESGYAGGVTLGAATGYSGAAAQLMSSTATKKYGLWKKMYQWVPSFPDMEDIYRIQSRLWTSDADVGEVSVGYSIQSSTDIEAQDITWISVDATTLSNSDGAWALFESPNITDISINQWAYLNLALWLATEGVVTATFDNFVLVQKQGDNHFFPRFTGAAIVQSASGPYHEYSDDYYKGDFFVADIVDDATMKGAFNEYYGLDDLFQTVGIGVFGNVNSATLVSCASTWMDIHSKYLAVDTGYGYRAPADTSRSVLNQDELPWPLQLEIEDEAHGQKNRFYAKYLRDQRFLYYGLLQRNPSGHAPLCFGEALENLPSAFDLVSTNGMDIQATPVFSDSPASATVEPELIGNYVRFFEDRQPIAIETSYQGNERGLLSSLTLVESEEDSAQFTNTYQLLLLDPIEGGLEIADASRTAGAVISATVTFNAEYVTEATPASSIVEGETYLVEVPLFGYKVAEFTTRAR